MRYISESDLAAYLDTYMERYRRRQDLFFRASLISVKPYSRGGYLCRLIRTGDVQSDQGDYLCVTPGYVPRVGDDVECMYRDKDTAFVLWPMTRLATGSIIQQIVTTQGQAAVQFQNIPPGFIDLEITYNNVRDTSATVGLNWMLGRVNGDAVAAGYYDEENHESAAVLAASENLAGFTGGRTGVHIGGGAGVSFAAAGDILIPGYNNPASVIRNFLWRSSARYASTTGTVFMYSGIMTYSAAIINRIDLLSNAGAWAAGCVFTLRGK